VAHGLVHEGKVAFVQKPHGGDENHPPPGAPGRVGFGVHFLFFGYDSDGGLAGPLGKNRSRKKKLWYPSGFVKKARRKPHVKLCAKLPDLLAASL